jgi:hypothetical protein
MPPAIEASIKTKVIQQWLAGDARAKIAIDNNIGEGTVGSLVNYFKIGLDNSEFDSARELALQAKKQGLNLSELSSNFRLHNFIKKSGASENQIESFIANVSSSELPPEKVVEHVNQLYDISKSESLPLEQVSSYIKQKLEEKRKIEEEIKQANDVLQSKNVSIEAINEHIQLNEKLNEHELSMQDIDKLLNVLVNANECEFDAKKIVGKLKKIQRLEKKENRLKNHCEILSEQVKECNKVLPLAQKMVAMNIDIKQLLLFDTAVNQIAKQYNLPLSVAALRLFNDIRDYNKIGGLKKELDKLLTQVFTVKACCFRQNKAMMAMLNLQSRGITEERILYINNLLENNGYNIDMKSNS